MAKYLDDVISGAMAKHLATGGADPLSAEFYKANRGAVRASMQKHGIKGRLLTRAAGQPKIHKSLGRGVATVILHLAPGAISGFEVCRWRTVECFGACLFSSGQGGIGRKGHAATLAESRKGRCARARIARTRWFAADPIMAMARLAHELRLHVRHAERAGMLPAARLNGTSDLCWEATGIVHAFPFLSFYDYTKGAHRLSAGAVPGNYDLTLSYSGHNAAACQEALDSGKRVAVVLYAGINPKKASFPPVLWGHAVTDADLHDYRPADPCGIMALRPKGRFIRESIFTARAERSAPDAMAEVAEALVQIR